MHLTLQEIGKAQSMSKWLKKFMGLVFVQPFHLLLYTIFAGTVFKMAEKTGGLNFAFMILIIAFFRFFSEAEGILKEMFQFDKDVSLSKGTGFAKMVLYDQTFKRIEKWGSNKKSGDEANQKPIYMKSDTFTKNNGQVSRTDKQGIQHQEEDLHLTDLEIQIFHHQQLNLLNITFLIQ